MGIPVLLVLLLPMVRSRSSAFIVTENFHEETQISDINHVGLHIVAVRHTKSCLLQCAHTCLQLRHTPAVHTDNMAPKSTQVTTRKDSETSVGFTLQNDSCVLFIPAKGRRKTVQSHTQIKLYLTRHYRQLLDQKTTIIPSKTATGITKTEPFTEDIPRIPIKPRDIRTFGGRCSVSRQCGYRHGFCLDGKCACGIGYSYDPTDEICVTRCVHYGSEFSAYKNSGFGGSCRRDVHRNLPPFNEDMTPERCTVNCLYAEGFTCVCVEVHLKECIFCDQPWSELEENQKHNGTEDGHTLLYRHCSIGVYTNE